MESRPADSIVIKLVLVDTPIKCHLLPLVTDFEVTALMLYGEANLERPKLRRGTWRIDVQLKHSGRPGIYLYIIY